MYADLVMLIAAKPEDEDVVAGPIGAAVFFGLVIVVALLLWNFTKQLKKVDRARDEGVFGDRPANGDAQGSDGPDAGSTGGSGGTGD